MLGTKKDHIFICNRYGKLLRDNSDLFLSKKAINSFGGYATQQLRRLQNGLANNGEINPEKESHILMNLQNQMNNMESRYKKLNNHEFHMYIDDSLKVNKEKEIFVDLTNIKHYPLRDLSNFVGELNNTIKDFDKLNHRNRKKDTTHLLKHSMHLIRLLITGTEILEGKGINTYREKDIPLLLSIRNGEYTYEEIFSMVDSYEKKFKYASINTSLPDIPDYNKIEDLIMSIYKDAYSLTQNK